MLATLLKVLTGPLTDSILDIVKSYLNTNVSQEQIKSEVEKKIQDTIQTAFQSHSEVVKSELQSDSWLAKSWRPIVALAFSFVIFYYVLLGPMLVAWLGVPPLNPGEVVLTTVMNMIGIYLTGYGLFRSAEKVIKR
jgi:hypothetical protein